jgi:uncharacterized protein YbjT (DUF2867 family)
LDKTNRKEQSMQPSRKIAVAGATGRVGRHVVDVLEAQGHHVVPISRSLGVDVVTGEGLAQALAGVESVIDAATGPSPEEDAATGFFTASARNLQELGEQAGVQRIVVVSIVGIDRSTGGGGYYAAKVAHEQMLLAGPIPVQILRATQFHEFVPQLMEWGKQDDAIYVPKMRTQLVAARSVAEALAGLTDGAAIAEIGGPREERLVDVARLLAARRGDRLPIVEVSNSADPLHELFENGGLLPGPDAAFVGPTFEEWLETQDYPLPTSAARSG